MIEKPLRHDQGNAVPGKAGAERFPQPWPVFFAGGFAVRKIDLNVFIVKNNAMT
jgi:hypothetical protein